MWKCVWQGKGKGTLWPVSALLLVRLHKAASPGAATVWGGGGLIASAPLAGHRPSPWALRGSSCSAVWPALWDSTFEGTTGPRHPASSPCRHALPVQSPAVVVALTDQAPKEVLGGVCPSLWTGGHRL